MKLTPQQIDFIRQNEQEDIRELALKLNNKGVEEEESEFVLKQIAGRQTAKNKIPSWYGIDSVIYPVHLSMEQASSEITAKYKAALLAEGTQSMVDLTGGLGVDFLFLSQRTEQAVYVEHNAELCEIARHNFTELGLRNFEIINEKGEDYLISMSEVDTIYLDPSRRDNSGRKVFWIEDCSPDAVEIKELLLKKAKQVIIKYSPMLDISLAVKSLENVSQVHIVSVENECKELLFLLSKSEKETAYYAVNLRNNNTVEKFYFTPQEEQAAEISFAETIGKYLYEPNTSILKAGAFKSVASQFGVQKLHINSHLYTSENLIHDFPGRKFEVKDWFVPNKKNIKSLLAKTEKANISVRNFPMSVAQIRKKTGLKEGGELYLFATTVGNGKKVWVVGEAISNRF